MKKTTFRTIDHYISGCPKEVATLLNSIRACIQKAAPQSEETISYNLPAFKQNHKVLVYFAAFKKHIGFYALPTGTAAFQRELATYKTGKGSIQFPINEEIPYALITRIVKFRLKEIGTDGITTR